MTTQTGQLIQALEENIGKAIFGKPDVIRMAVVALLGDGHLLIEDAPGVGKTSLAKAVAQSLNCDFTRLQCTPDMLPSDIIGSSVFLPNEGQFEFRKGPLFTNVLLADEINRTTPRTQSALLEAMQEHQVSIDGETYALNRPFFVLATQNPFEFEGTYPLPENQLDRFMLRIEIGYPERDSERNVLQKHRDGQPVEQLTSVLSGEQLRSIQQSVREVKVDDSLNDYILDIIEGTRQHDELTLGVSTRGAITYYRAVQALATAEGRDFVTPDDVKRLAIPVLAHRVVCRGLIRENQRERAISIIQQIVDSTPVPD